MLRGAGCLNVPEPARHVTVEVRGDRRPLYGADTETRLK